MARRLQNRIAESRYTLPVLIPISLGVWVMEGLTEGLLWGALACFVVTVVMLIRLNRIHALLRIYSPVVSCSFLLLSMAACPLLADFHATFVQMCMAVCITLLFPTYRDKKAVGHVYYAYLCIGVSSLFFVQILCLVPFLWLMQGAMLRSLSWRTWMAGLFGVLTPYWYWFCVQVYLQDLTPLAGHFQPLTVWGEPFDCSAWSIWQWGMVALLFFGGLTGVVHYMRQGYLDGVRVRCLHHFFIGATLLTIVALLLQPVLYGWLVPLLTLFVSPLVAHFAMLTHTRLTNIVVLTLILFALLLTAYNLRVTSLLL